MMIIHKLQIPVPLDRIALQLPAETQYAELLDDHPDQPNQNFISLSFLTIHGDYHKY